jgi:hypothetical protein
MPAGVVFVRGLQHVPAKFEKRLCDLRKVADVVQQFSALCLFVGQGPSDQEMLPFNVLGNRAVGIFRAVS